MATFNGNLKDFNDFIGPVTRNIVCNLSRKHKRNTTCRHEGCNKRKPLEAAHVKGKERPTIIARLLESFHIDDDYYEVDLIEFKKKFIEAHEPIEQVILPMCKEHHLEYDRKEGIDPEYPITLDEFQTEDGGELYSEKELELLDEKDLLKLKTAVQEIDISNIKEEVSKIYNLSKSQITFSRVSESNGLWNFDINKKKFKKDFAFIFYDQAVSKYNVALFKASSVNLDGFSEKDKDVVRFFVDKNLLDRSEFDFNAFLIESKK